MARKQFVVTYPDRSKSHISRSERDRLLLSLLIESTGPNQYRYVGRAVSCHSFTDLSRIKESYFKPIGQTGFMPGSFVIDYGDRKVFEVQAYPGEMEIQLREQRQIA